MSCLRSTAAAAAPDHIAGSEAWTSEIQWVQRCAVLMIKPGGVGCCERRAKDALGCCQPAIYVSELLDAASLCHQHEHDDELSRPAQSVQEGGISRLAMAAQSTPRDDEGLAPNARSRRGSAGYAQARRAWRRMEREEEEREVDCLERWGSICGPDENGVGDLEQRRPWLGVLERTSSARRMDGVGCVMDD